MTHENSWSSLRLYPDWLWFYPFSPRSRLCFLLVITNLTFLFHTKKLTKLLFDFTKKILENLISVQISMKFTKIFISRQYFHYCVCLSICDNFLLQKCDRCRTFTDQIRPALGSVGCLVGCDHALDHLYTSIYASWFIKRAPWLGGNKSGFVRSADFLPYIYTY